METAGQIEIRISGSQGRVVLTPQTLDIRDVRRVLEHAEALLFGGRTTGAGRPLVSYELRAGSVRHIFTTARQVVIGFAAILQAVTAEGSLDMLTPPTAQVLETLQELARQRDYVIEISTSGADAAHLRLDASTHYQRSTPNWVAAEFYFYGIITDLGGQDRPNLHLRTDEVGTLVVQATKEQLRHLAENVLYRKYGVRATGQQDLRTGEMDRGSLQLVELLDYAAQWDAHYLADLRTQAARRGTFPADPDAWLRHARGLAA